MLRAVIVGLGGWGQMLTRSVHGKSDRIRIVRGVTRTLANAEAFSSETGIPISDKYAAALADPAVDAIVLATPHSQHVEQILAAAAAGKHIFVEKPLALRARDARRAFAACNDAGVVLAVGQNRRFLPAVAHLAQMLHDGTLGQPLHVEGNYSTPSGFRRAATSWRNDPSESPSGGMSGLGVHVTDLMIALFGPVEEVNAVSLRQVLTRGVHDTTTMLLRFRSGMTGYLLTLTATADVWRFQIFGSKGWAEMRGNHRLAVNLIDGEETIIEFPTTDIERAELEAFADAVEGKHSFPVLANEAIENIALLEAVGRSAAQGRPCLPSEFLK